MAGVSDGDNCAKRGGCLLLACHNELTRKGKEDVDSAYCQQGSREGSLGAAEQDSLPGDMTSRS